MLCLAKQPSYLFSSLACTSCKFDDQNTIDVDVCVFFANFTDICTRFSRLSGLSRRVQSSLLARNHSNNIALPFSNRALLSQALPLA
jgi:hypothetical protein